MALRAAVIDYMSAAPEGLLMRSWNSVGEKQMVSAAVSVMLPFLQPLLGTKSRKHGRTSR